MTLSLTFFDLFWPLTTSGDWLLGPELRVWGRHRARTLAGDTEESKAGTFYRNQIPENVHTKNIYFELRIAKIKQFENFDFLKLDILF